MIVRGAFHVHSSHSYDAKVPLPALCAQFRARGLQFALFTEHDDALDAEAYSRIVAECDGLSDAGFLAVPGIEVRCWRTEGEQWHIAAVGVRQWIPRGPIPEVVAAITRASGLAILLHPHKYSDSIDPQELAGFHGLEAWNGKEDGRWSPRFKTLGLAQRVARVEGLPMYGGMDLHDLERVADIGLEAEVETLAPEPLLGALRRGTFWLYAHRFRFPALRGPGFGQRLALRLLRAAYTAYGRLRKISIVNRMLARRT